jgi:hypothetical protein
MSTDDTHEALELPVKKTPVNLTLNDFLSALAEATRSKSGSTSTPGSASVVQPEIAAHLRHLPDHGKEYCE